MPGGGVLGGLCWPHRVIAIPVSSANESLPGDTVIILGRVPAITNAL
jgi:hypothetical protein